MAAHADKKSINSFHYWLLIFNYEAPCNFQRSQIPPIKQVLQVGAAPVGWQIPSYLPESWDRSSVCAYLKVVATLLCSRAD